jgi:transposase
MRDTELYAQILGLGSPWFVERVELDVKAERVDVFVAHAPELRWKCPQCERELPCRDHAPEREWRHLDTCQLRTFLRGRIPRVECPEHGVVQVDVPWSGPRSRFTMLFERFAIDVITQCANVTGSCRLLRISWDECFALMERAVARGRARKKSEVIPLLSVDEKAIARRYRYMTLVCDYGRSTVEHIVEGRSEESLASYWKSLSKEQLEGIEAVSMDMWEPYVQATLKGVPGAREKIVYDRYHVMRHMVEAVDRVRRRENRELREVGDERLTGTKYLWLFSEENLPEKHRASFEALKASTLKVARAWAIKESLRDLWSYASRAWARRFFWKWYAWATRSKLDPVRAVASMIRRHLPGVVNYCRVRVTNALVEGINSRVSAIQRRACGYRNAEHFKTAVYFFCGGLDLYPR